jgi:hypothetical protein
MAQTSAILLSHFLLAFHYNWLIALTHIHHDQEEKVAKAEGKILKGTSLEKNWITEDSQKMILKVQDKLGLVKEKEPPRFFITTKGTDAQKPGQMYENQNCWLHKKRFSC